MVALQIRDVPDGVRDELVRRARDNGQSLQAYLLDLIKREAAFANNLAVLDDVERWEPSSTATVDDVLASIQRERRDA